MGTDMSREFIELMNKFRKISHRYSLHKNIPPGEFMMLMTIHCNMEHHENGNNSMKGVRVSELSKLLHASKPAVSRTLKNIEDKELVERITDKKDRRLVFVELTEKGKLIIEEAIKDTNERIIYILNQLGEEDTVELMRIVTNLIDIVQDYNDLISNKNNKEG